VKFYINDRLFMGVRLLKCRLIDPDRGRLVPQIRVADDSGKIQAVEVTSPNLEPDREGWAGQFSTSGLRPGRYFLDVFVDEKNQVHYGFTVIDAVQFDSMLKMLTSDAASAPRTPFSGVAELRPRWLLLWNRVNQFLEGSRLTIPFDAPEFREASGLENTCLEAFDLIGFHVLRFLVDQVFWDGAIHLDRLAGKPLLSFRFTVYAKTPVPVGAARLDEWGGLTRALNSFGYQAEIKWNPNRSDATLELALGRSLLG